MSARVYRHALTGREVKVLDETRLAGLVERDANWREVEGKPKSIRDMKVPELKAEIEGRNEGRDEADRISTKGKLADLVAALEADDEAQADDDSADGDNE